MSKSGKPQIAQALRIIVPAGQASPSPPVGPALGQRGVKSMDFCKQFNERSKMYTPGTPLPCFINVKPDRTFTFDIKSPTTSWLLRQAAGVEKGSGRPRDSIAGSVSLKHIYAIAKLKESDAGLTDIDIKNICLMIMGTAKNMGIEVVA